MFAFSTFDVDGKDEEIRFYYSDSFSRPAVQPYVFMTRDRHCGAGGECVSDPSAIHLFQRLPVCNILTCGCRCYTEPVPFTWMGSMNCNFAKGNDAWMPLEPGQLLFLDQQRIPGTDWILPQRFQLMDAGVFRMSYSLPDHPWRKCTLKVYRDYYANQSSYERRCQPRDVQIVQALQPAPRFIEPSDYGRLSQPSSFSLN